MHFLGIYTWKVSLMGGGTLAQHWMGRSRRDLDGKVANCSLDHNASMIVMPKATESTTQVPP